MLENCPVCLNSAEISRLPNGRDGYSISCPRCGSYSLSRTFAATNFEKYGSRHVLSGIIRNRFEMGDSLDLHPNNFQSIIDSINVPSNPFDIIDLLLEHFQKKAGKTLAAVEFDPAKSFPLIFAENPGEFIYYLNKAIELEYLEYESSQSIIFTLKGWKRILEFQKLSSRPKQAFVAMWFNNELDEIWELGFKEALQETGHTPIRIDLQEHNEKICDRIIAEIRRSGLLIADFTGQRGGVYFEAGFAMGLGIPVIWTCRENEIENVHFDTRQYNHIVWQDSQDLKTKLMNRIKATIL